MPPETPQGLPESIAFESFEGLKNTVTRERLGSRDLAVAVNIDLDDVGQPHRRRGRTQVATGNFQSLFNADDGTVYGVKNGDLGIINPDYSFTTLLVGINENFEGGQTPLTYWQLDGKIYFTSSDGAGIITHATGEISEWGPAQNFFLSPVVNPTATLPAIRVRLMGPPPLAAHMAYYNGRFYLAQGKMLWATEPFLYTLVDKTRGFIQFENEITMVGVVTDGLYVGTNEGVWFLQGGSFEKLARTRVMDSPAIAGTMIYIPGELANPPQVGTSAVTPMMMSIAFMTTRGYCVGSDSGKCSNMTEAKFIFPNAKRGMAFYRRQDGQNQYITNLDSEGSPTNAARFGEYVDVSIRRGFNGSPPPVIPIPPLPPFEQPGAFKGWGALLYDTTFAVNLLDATPWQLDFSLASGVNETNALLQGLLDTNFWTGNQLASPSANSVFIVKLVIAITPLVVGGSLDVGIGGSNVPPFPNETSLTYPQGTGTSQKLEYVFPILAQAGLINQKGYIILNTSVPAELTGVRLGIYPVSP